MKTYDRTLTGVRWISVSVKTARALLEVGVARTFRRRTRPDARAAPPGRKKSAARFQRGYLAARPKPLLPGQLTDVVRLNHEMVEAHGKHPDPQALAPGALEQNALRRDELADEAFGGLVADACDHKLEVAQGGSAQTFKRQLCLDAALFRGIIA